MSNEVVLTSPTGEDLEYLRSLGGGALETLRPTDIIMPRWRLIQNTSKTGTPGMWASNVNPDRELSVLGISILEISNHAVYFGPKGQNNDRPLCRSNDGISKSDPNGVGAMKCKGCQFNIWTKGPDGRPVKPLCSSGYTFLCLVSLPDGVWEPGMVSFKGSANKICKSYFTEMKTRGVAPFAYITSCTSKAIVNDKGRFFIPEFAMGPWLSREQIEFAHQQYIVYKQYITAEHMADVEYESESTTVEGGSNVSSGASEFLDSLNSTSPGLSGPASSAAEDDDIPF